MKIAVMGVGAMGSIYAALLADAGHEVWAVDTWANHVDAINANGLRVEGASGDRTVETLRATGQIADVGPCDLCLIATKASGVGPAAQEAAKVIGPDALVLTIQNGLGAGERIAQHIPAENVLLGVADGFGASMKGPGHAHHNAMKLIRIGEINGGLTDRLRQVEAVWQGAGFNAKAFENITQLIWEKFLCNVTFSAPCTTFNQTVGELMSTPDHWQIALGAMSEAYEIARAKDVPLSFDDPIAYVSQFGGGMPNARPSMLLDHMAGRASELDAINGIVPVMGRELGIPTPINDTLAAILRQREAAFGAS
ncbi:ketopantoate reductase [Shimia gijangensis]|uniref:2-dehydropantoate 2-reductase n=1 Tax=Shimia gijangensis TaxID=1470563 RepID=A0A1M6C8S5_9RHOB|nr:2-dehydropantoate 2-reductase [Shimia gijangensis]SHI57409.1 ketopantoate reductase [Shimia gijangensis]